MSNYAIRTEELVRDFESVRAVDGLSIDVPAGIVFGFLGPNGSGKTTTIHLLLGLIQPTSGRATVLGFDSVRESGHIRGGAGVLLEHHGLYERLSAEQNLDFAGRAARMTGPDRARRIEELLTHLGLWERRSQPVGSWSRGMKQKVAVARALLTRPRLIFLDEPTAGLDVTAAAGLRADLLTLVSESGATVFLTTHDLTEAEKLCAQVAVVQSGRVIATGSPEELRRNTSKRGSKITARRVDPGLLAQLQRHHEVDSILDRGGRVEVMLRPGAEIAPVISLIAAAGAAVDDVSQGSGDLEDAFLNLIDRSATT